MGVNIRVFAAVITPDGELLNDKEFMFPIDDEILLNCSIDEFRIAINVMLEKLQSKSQGIREYKYINHTIDEAQVVLGLEKELKGFFR